MKQSIKHSSRVQSDSLTEKNDCNSFSACFMSFSKESEIAIRNHIPVTFIEGNSVYKTRDGINKVKVIETSPLVKIGCKSFRII